MEDQKEKRTEQEKYAMGLLSPIFREINIKQDTRGYMPLVDLLCYAYAYPNVPFQEIMEILTKRNHYVGVKWIQEAETIKDESILKAATHHYEKQKQKIEESFTEEINKEIEKTINTVVEEQIEKVEEKDVVCISPNIQEVNANRIISFNYTHIYEKLMCFIPKIE